MDSSFPWLVLVLLCQARQLVNSLNDEGNALWSFKSSTEDPRNFLSNWNSFDPTPCSWNGVKCRDDKVVSLTITNKGLAGVLPSVLGNLSSMRQLDLRNNKLSGSLPVRLFEMRGLQSLALSGNLFSSVIPREIENLRALQVLNLSGNSFNGTIPSSLLHCTRLRTLDLSCNNFSGSLPEGLGTGLIALQSLDLSFNKLDGMIPGDLGNLSNLKEKLDLSHNSFYGHIPESLGNIRENVYVDLSYNNLSGLIPKYDVLLNSGPTAFIGNPFLCGLPLKSACPPDIPNPFSQSLPHFPSQESDGSSYSGKGSRHLSKGSIIMIVSISMVGSCFLGWLLSYNCKNSSCKASEHSGSCIFDEKTLFRRELFCFRNAVLDNSPEKMEQYNFVPLDMEVNFNLDKLLKAPAFLLGKTSNGIVYKVVLEDGQSLAVRRLGEGGSPRQKDFQTEVEAIGKIRHPNIVRLRAYCWSVDEKLLIYDFVPNGDLASALHGKSGFTPSIPLSWTTRLRIMKGIAKGLVYLHEISPKKYVHGDLRPSNVLLGENMEPQISNLGHGRLADVAGCSSSSFQLDQLVMTTPEQQTSPYELTAINTVENLRSYYQAPEASRASKPSQKWDIYSLGMILLEMITGKLPIVEVGSFKFDLIRWLQVSIEEGIPLRDIVDPSMLHDLDKEEEMAAVLKIGLACVHKNPERRPSTRHVLNSMDKLVRLSIEV